MATQTDEIKLNGVTADKALMEMLAMYRQQNAKGDTVVPENHPVIKRQSRLDSNEKGLEGLVKKSLGDNPRFNPHADYAKADEIIRGLAYELAKTEGHKGELKDFKDEDARRVLSRASQETGNPVFGNKTAFIQSILDLAYANPDSKQYDRNAPIAQLISYIARERDTESKKIVYYRQLFAEKWQRPGDGIALQNQFSAATGIPLARTATANEAFGELERKGQYDAQGALLKLPKTYLASPKSQLDKAA